MRAVAAAANGRTLFAGLAGGVVFRSINRGRTWVRGGEGLRGTLLDVQNAEVSPATVYALTTEGVFASFDAGRTWAWRGTGLPDGPFDLPPVSLVVAPSDASVLYVVARTREGEFFADVHHVYRSLNAGATWKRASRGLADGFPLNQIFDLAVDPSNPRTVYAATSQGVFRTTDGGGRWKATRLTEAALLVAIDGVDPDAVYAVTVDLEFGTPRRIQVSADRGRSWRERGELEAIVLESHPTREGTAYAFTVTPAGNQLLETTDGGRSWRPIGDGLPVTGFSRVNDLALDPVRPDALYAALESSGTDPGLFESEDGGESFRSSASGIVGIAITSLTFQPGDAGGVFAALASDGVHRLDVESGVWGQLGLDRQEVLALVVDPAASGTFYAIADPMRRVYHSGDDAHTFTLASTASQDTTFRTALAVVEGAVWAGGFPVVSWHPAQALWEQRLDVEGREVASAGSGPTTRVWVGDVSGIDAGGGTGALYVSTDAGASFTVVLRPPGEILDVALLDDAPDRVAAGYGEPGLNSWSTGGVFLSDDGGATWRFTTAAADAPPIFSVALDPLDPLRILAGGRGRVSESLDGGATWHGLGRGLARGALVTELAFDPSGDLYAATLGGGVFRLRDSRP